MYLLSKRLKLGSIPITDAVFPRATGPDARGVALVFGNEVDGLKDLDEEVRDSLPALYLPMRDDVIRSYNLSNAVSCPRRGRPAERTQAFVMSRPFEEMVSGEPGGSRGKGVAHRS